jgi:ubiquinone/menaquinone biosynthesis C-methylase UbiE
MFDLTHPTQFKRLVRASFDKTDPSYGTQGDFHWQFASRLLAHTPIQAGDILVDVATGTAPAAIMAAQRVGAQGQIVGLDISPGILAQARHHLATAEVPNCVLVCGDAEALPLRDACADGIVCSSAIVWLPTIPRALADWYRVLRPSGWLAFSCFGGLARQTSIGLLSRLLKPYGQLLPELNAPLNSSGVDVAAAEGNWSARLVLR